MSETRKLIENIDIKSWYNLLLRKEQYSHYIDRPLKHQIKCVQSELNELLQWIEKNDSDNIKEEIIDVIYNTIQLLQSLLKKWLIDENCIKESGKNQYNKIVKRQPQLKEQKKLDTFQQEHDLFVLLKNKWE